MSSEFRKRGAAGQTPRVAIEIAHNIASDGVALDATTKVAPLGYAAFSNTIGLHRPLAESGSELR